MDILRVFQIRYLMTTRSKKMGCKVRSIYAVA